MKPGNSLDLILAFEPKRIVHAVAQRLSEVTGDSRRVTRHTAIAGQNG